MVLMAQSLGVGTCFSGLLVFALPGSPALRALLQIPREHRTPVAFVVGHPGVTFLRLVTRKPAMALWLQFDGGTMEQFFITPTGLG
jgi:hypothetical protein